MSDIYSIGHEATKSMIGVYLVDDIGNSTGIERAQKLLAGMPHAAEKAIGSAIKRAAISGENYAARAVSKYYYITNENFKKYTKSKRRIHTSAGETTVDIEFRGQHIPLLRFKSRIGADGRIHANVKRSSSGDILSHVFRRTVGSHVGLFERVGLSSLPIEEKLGPSAPQMMSANDDVSQAIGDKVRETFDSRIEHEILAIMNGWRK